jgi:hypothetical protein
MNLILFEVAFNNVSASVKKLVIFPTSMNVDLTMDSSVAVQNAAFEANCDDTAATSKITKAISITLNISFFCKLFTFLRFIFFSPY